MDWVEQFVGLEYREGRGRYDSLELPGAFGEAGHSHR